MEYNQQRRLLDCPGYYIKMILIGYARLILILKPYLIQSITFFFSMANVLAGFCITTILIQSVVLQLLLMTTKPIKMANLQEALVFLNVSMIKLRLIFYLILPGVGYEKTECRQWMDLSISGKMINIGACWCRVSNLQVLG